MTFPLQLRFRGQSGVNGSGLWGNRRGGAFTDFTCLDSSKIEPSGEVGEMIGPGTKKWGAFNKGAAIDSEIHAAVSNAKKHSSLPPFRYSPYHNEIDPSFPRFCILCNCPKRFSLYYDLRRGYLSERLFGSDLFLWLSFRQHQLLCCSNLYTVSIPAMARIGVYLLYLLFWYGF